MNKPVQLSDLVRLPRLTGWLIELIIMEVSQISSKELISYAVERAKKSNPPRKEYFRLYYTKNKQKYLLSKQNHRLKLKLLKPPKPLSFFQQLKLKQLLKLLVNHRSFVPVAPKLKHPVIKNWNADNYWYSKKLDLNNLERGCVRIYENQWKDCAIIWIDIDCRKWTKLAKLFRCGYIKSPKGHIRIPIPIKDLQSYKTGTLYYQGTKIGDAKLSGEVMLPGNAYYDKEGNFLGYYEYKAWGTFFPFNNKIWNNIEELFSFLQAKVGIEYKTIREHFFIVKNKEKVLIKDQNPFKGQALKEQLFSLSVKGPPWPNGKVIRKYSSKIGI